MYCTLYKWGAREIKLQPESWSSVEADVDLKEHLDETFKGWPCEVHWQGEAVSVIWGRFFFKQNLMMWKTWNGAMVTTMKPWQISFLHYINQILLLLHSARPPPSALKERTPPPQTAAPHCPTLAEPSPLITHLISEPLRNIAGNISRNIAKGLGRVLGAQNWT